MLTSHQRVAILRAVPEARIEGEAIRVGRWTIVAAGARLDLPRTRGPTGWDTDGCDQAMEIWTRLRTALGISP